MSAYSTNFLEMANNVGTQLFLLGRNESALYHFKLVLECIIDLNSQNEMENGKPKQPTVKTDISCRLVMSLLDTQPARLLIQ